MTGDQFPLASHTLVPSPTKSYPVLQLYSAVFMNVVPDEASTLPLAGSAKAQQSTAEKKDTMKVKTALVHKIIRLQVGSVSVHCLSAPQLRVAGPLRRYPLSHV